jgi:predicted dehydrogenase
VLDLLVHDFDQSIALFGMPIDAVVESLESDHTVRCVLHYAPSDHPNGLTVEITGGWFGDDRPFSMGFHARFRDAELVFRDNRLSVLSPGALPQDLPLPSVDPYAEQIRYFIECCRSHSKPVECPPESSAAAVTLALAVSSLAHAESGKLTVLQWS